jgi:hypothetical protein
MDEMKLRQRRATRRAVVRSVIIVATCAFASPFAVSAQATVQSNAPERASRPLLLAGARKSGPLEGSATVGMLIPVRPLERSGDFGGKFLAYRGVLVEAAAGADGLELAAGWGRRLKLPKGPALFGEDILATAFQTRKSGTEATYVGGEVGLTMLMMRMSVGAATRVSGPPDEPDRTIFTWGFGFNFGR